MATVWAPASAQSSAITATDGLHQGKNVLVVIGPHEVSARHRFDASSAGSASSLQNLSISARTLAVSSRSKVSPMVSSPGVLSPFLPPTVSFVTNSPGGWNGSNPWFTVGGQSYPDNTPPSSCSGSRYMVVVLNRQTLAEQTSSPESSRGQPGLTQSLLSPTSAYTFIATIGTTSAKTPKWSTNGNGIRLSNVVPLKLSRYTAILLSLDHMPRGMQEISG